MDSGIAARLQALNLALPQAPAPSASYVPWVRTGNLVFISGQVPKSGGKDAYVGKLGREFDVAQGQEAARLCALSLLAHLDSAVQGDIGRVRRCVRLGGFVNSTPEFGEHPQVLNGASELMLAVFGDAGRHARAAVGVAGLPRGVAVEVEGLFEIAG